MQQVEADAIVVLHQPHLGMAKVRAEPIHEVPVLAHHDVREGLLEGGTSQVGIGEAVAIHDLIHRMDLLDLLHVIGGIAQQAALVWLRVADPSRVDVTDVPGLQRYRNKHPCLHVGGHDPYVAHGVEIVIIEMDYDFAARKAHTHVPLQAHCEVALEGDVDGVFAQRGRCGGEATRGAVPVCLDDDNFFVGPILCPEASEDLLMEMLAIVRGRHNDGDP
mmetsp:Transcript_89952/g.201074  ORF Transcript_89952/g.201074 Transcript_89952/m.201074 type:complete len:219 (-) Transcript_89952:37-693(-)